MAYDPRKFNPADVSSFPTADGVRPFEIDLSRGILKSDGEEDHKRMMEALAIMKTMPAPQAPAAAQYSEPQPAQTITLSKALVAYLPTLEVTEKTRGATATAIQKFIKFRGDIDVHTVRDIDVSNWNTELLRTKKSDGELPAKRSVDNAIQFLQGLLKWAVKKSYIHRSTPLATEGQFNLTKKQRNAATKGAEPFSVEQLNQIFNPISFNRYHQDSPSRKWIPLIALYTGMRLEEIAQLTTSDVIAEQGSGVLYFDINRNGGKTVKTDTALRNIPIHDTLLKLGFMDFVSQQSKKLFEETGNAVSRAFIRYLEELNIKKDGDRGMVFHSFRDTFNNLLALPSVQVQERLRYALMGHSKEGDTNALNYTKQILVSDNKLWGVDKLVFVETVGGVTYRLVL